jgi:putative hemolysin
MEKEGSSLSENKPTLSIPGGTVLTETLLQIFEYKLLNKVYSESDDKDPVKLIDTLLCHIDMNIDLPEEDIKNIPAEGPFIAVSNHPFRGIDSMLLFRTIQQRRNDFKIMGSHLLLNIEPLRDIILPVNTYETKLENKSSFTGIRLCLEHLKNGHCVGIFPTAEDSKHWVAPRIILDREWNPAALKLIRLAGVPVVPVYFHGTKSRISHIMRRINPKMGDLSLPSELAKKRKRKRKRTIKMRIGAPIPLKEQNEFVEPEQFGRYLRARVYSLGSNLEKKNPVVPIIKTKKQKAEPVIERAPAEALASEFERIKPDYELFSTRNYSLICAPADVIPNIFQEIGRQREITFREVGEGTNKSIDIDEFDMYYYHLFIWDSEENKLVGAYRIGKGKDIVNIYGVKGFYINSLFRIKNSFAPILSESLELGRSFITKEYQKKAMPLFLLWKGIMIFLLRHSEYRYLIGPVSISNDLSQFSKSLIVEFIRTYFFDEKLSGSVTPKKDFIVKTDKIIDHRIFIDSSEKDITKIERIIIDIEPGYRIPVLLKKYLEINGKIMGFNIDPKFNNCLDGLLILDIYATPPEIIKGLSREMNDPSIMDRFRR